MLLTHHCVVRADSFRKYRLLEGLVLSFSKEEFLNWKTQVAFGRVERHVTNDKPTSSKEIERMRLTWACGRTDVYT